MTEAGLKKEEFLNNSILFRNLQAYLIRYPQDEKRIFDVVLRHVTGTPKISDFKLAPPGPSYRARLCFMTCIMDPKFWTETAELWQSDAYFIVEPNVEAVALAFQTVELQDYFLTSRFHFFLGYAGEDVIAPMQRVLRQTAYAGKLHLSQVIGPTAPDGIDQKWVDYVSGFNEILRQTINHVFFNFGHINDSIEGFRSTFENFERIRQAGGVTELENIHKGKPICVIGAGHSLDLDLPLLKANQDKFIIVAVDAAVKPLVEWGIRIDYATSIERYNDGGQDPFFRDLPPLETDLIVYPVVHREILKLWPGTVRFTYRNYAWYAYFEKNWPMGILESGGSASHLASRLAVHLGAECVILIGCDMTYEKHPERDAWRSHCSLKSHPEWNVFKTHEEIAANKKDYCGFFDVEANDGTQVKTHTVYHQWAKEYSTMALSYPKVPFLTTAARGIKTPRVEYVPFKEIVETAQPIDVTRKTPANTRPLNNVGHEILLKNVQGFKDIVDKAVEVLNELWDAKEIKRGDILETCTDLLYKKMAYDYFFTAFVVQNSAMEYFKAESLVWAVPEGDLEDENYSRRVFALRTLYLVLKDIIDKTVDVLEKAVKGEL